MTTVQQPPAASRRPPPPCWSKDDTVALINAYRHKWYSLQRGNLRAPDWQEVADTVAFRCHGDPPKTSVQCRHKMEKLRKRYRTEVQRIRNPNNLNNFNNPRLLHKCSSSWVHFSLMDNMECGVTCSNPSVNPNEPRDQEEDEEDLYNEEGDDDFCLYPKGNKQAIALPLNRQYQGSVGHGTGTGTGTGTGSGVRIRIPSSSVVARPTISDKNVLCDDLPPRIRGQYGSGVGFGNGSGGINGCGGVKRKEGDVMSEMVAAIERLGDGFMKTESMKMDMARELEVMRMKMERKRTEMIIETQQKVWDSFVKRVMEKKSKKVKRMVAPEW